MLLELRAFESLSLDDAVTEKTERLQTDARATEHLHLFECGCALLFRGDALTGSRGAGVHAVLGTHRRSGISSLFDAVAGAKRQRLRRLQWKHVPSTSSGAERVKDNRAVLRRARYARTVVQTTRRASSVFKLGANLVQASDGSRSVEIQIRLHAFLPVRAHD